MINKESSIKKVLKSSAKMGSATFISRVLGLVREQAMAAVFGASGLTDAFLVAYRVPNLLRDLFAEGAFSSAFVPVFTEVLQVGEKEARRLMWSLFIILSCITGTISLLIIWFAPEVVHLFTDSAFSADVEKFEITVVLVRIMAPFLIVISLAALFMGALNALKVFFLPALAPAFFNVIMIASIIILPSIFKDRGLNPIYGLGVGVIVGGVVQMLVQIPLIFKNKFGPLGPIKIISEHTKKIVNRVGIGTIGIGANQLNLLVTTILATGSGVGAVSWLTYAFRLFQFPVGILSVSIAGSNLVHFSDAWKQGDKVRAREILKASYTLSWFLIIPAFALLYALSTESMHLVFERGAFHSTDTAMAAMALRCYLYGLPFYGIYKIFAPTFFSIDMPKIPIILSVVTVTINIIFCVIFIEEYGFKILAFGTSLSMFINTVAQSLFLKKLLELPLKFFINLKIVKVLLAGGLTLFATKYLAVNYFNYGAAFLTKLFTFCAIGLIGVAIYALSLVILGEFETVKKVFNKNK